MSYSRRIISSASIDISRFNFVISLNVDNWNLNTEMLSLGWGGISPVIVTIIINTGIRVGSTTTAIPGMDLGTQAFGSEITLTLNGTAEINGKGGAGSSVGGKGLFTRTTVEIIDNSSGEINGGGGGGGRGGNGAATSNSCVSGIFANGGSGGSGYGNASLTFGNSGEVVDNSPCQIAGGGEGCSGTSSYVATGGTGGNGGGKGAAGGTGSNGSINSNCTTNISTAGDPGSAGGNAVDGVSYVTYNPKPTVNGSEVN